MTALTVRRLTYTALAVATIVLGLLVRLRGAMLGAAARDVITDSTWAAMIFWGVSAIAPSFSLRVRGIVSLAICVAVETSQLYHTPALDAVRRTTVGHLVLGSDFDARDLVAYAVGVFAMVLADWAAHQASSRRAVS